jgi:hypothetical protein
MLAGLKEENGCIAGGKEYVFLLWGADGILDEGRTSEEDELDAF